MNKERLLALADMIEKGTHKFNGITTAFNMSEWFTHENNIPCGPYTTVEDRHGIFVSHYVPVREDIKDPFACNTTACMAGFACLMFDYENTVTGKRGSPGIAQTARYLLGLSEYQADELFTGMTHGFITGKDAARVIRHFVETGEINWSVRHK